MLDKLFGWFLWRHDDLEERIDLENALGNVARVPGGEVSACSAGVRTSTLTTSGPALDLQVPVEDEGGMP